MIEAVAVAAGMHAFGAPFDDDAISAHGFDTAAILPRTPPLTVTVQAETGSTVLRPLFGACPPCAAMPGSVILTLPAFGYAAGAAETR